MDDRPISSTLLAARLRLPGEWLEHLAEAGEIPSLLPPGGRRLFNEAAVRRALLELAGRTTEPTT